MTGLALLAASCAGLAAWWASGAGGISRLAAADPQPPPVLHVRLRPGWERVRRRLPETRSARARRALLRSSVPGVCELLAVCVEAGSPPRVAVSVVAEAVGGAPGEVLLRVVRSIDLGVEERAAWRALAEVPGYGAVARDLARAAAHGTGLAALLRRHAEEARRDATAAAQATARAAGVQAVLPLVACFLPAFLLLGVVPILASVFSGLFA